jgi:beta-glucosidase
LAGAWDFLGMNYYTRMHPRMALSPRRPIVLEQINRSNEGLTDLGWEIYPAGFFHQLTRMYERCQRPIWITENGIADNAGTTRVRYLHDHLMALLAAVRSGVVIERYEYWTLMDNFEWLEGLGPRFGLYRVDFQTLERTPTSGQSYFKQTIAKHCLVPVTAAA